MMKILLILPLFIIVGCTSDTDEPKENIHKTEEIESISFKKWAEDMPYVLGSDTLNSKNWNLTIKEYDNTYKPDNVSIVGRWYAVDGSGATPKFHAYYMIYIYNENDSYIPYIEVYDSSGVREYSKRLFDQHFIEEDSTHFSRCYRERPGKNFVFENCILKDGKVKVIRQEKVDTYKMIRRYST